MNRLLFILFLSLVVGCGGGVVTTTKHYFIKRVFLHDARHVSFFIQEKGNPEIQHTHIYCDYRNEPKFVADVPEGEDMWAEQTVSQSGGGYSTSVVVHIHDVSDVEGAGWNHGKHGSGMTQVIE